MRIANWAYTQTFDCQGLAWLRGDELVPLQPDWSKNWHDWSTDAVSRHCAVRNPFAFLSVHLIRYRAAPSRAVQAHGRGLRRRSALQASKPTRWAATLFQGWYRPPTRAGRLYGRASRLPGLETGAMRISDRLA